ncbi:Maltose/maltodextrin ABC transporter, permease protein MalG [Klebsiella pneumoniae IS43]|uniref:Maltose/maltodextrin ABC transporter, permease protein MalG n=1 Tax=Klebsiella pneumoniae IS43 TaxID=1432552 RepID=W1DTG5_KLEPN|nr:Maltose/maltodextrin ABC transporter, permease protein MalG [Klebsiella pneumoniae IS43]
MLFLLLQMIPQFSALIAIFVLSQLLGLINSHLALVLIYVGGDDPDEYLVDERVSRRDP